jgi:hypothetical protein
MESYDERRRREEERRQGRQEDSGRHRDTWWQRGGHDEDRSQRSEDRSQRAESGWPDYGRDYSRSDERQGRREEGRDERSRFSPDWSREGAEPRYSDLPYYSRNRDQDPGDYSRRERSGGSQSDDRRLWEQRARASVPRSQQNLAEHGEPGDYYDPDWPYDRGRQRDLERSRGEQRTRGRQEEGSHYRGYYTQSGGPFSYPGGQGYVFSESLTLQGPYTGRGPKGYKRSDEKIVEEACQRLERDGDIDASNIEVSAEDGVIRLSGTVEDRQTKRRAEECVESIYGARDVMNELRVTRQSGEQWQGSQGTQASQSGRGSSQTSQSGQGTQVSQGTSTPGQRPGAGSASSDQLGENKPSPRH